MKYKPLPLLIILLIFQYNFCQNSCFNEETIKVYKESKKESHKKTMDWLVKASKANHGTANHKLGLIYVNGNNSTSVDYKKAYSYFKKAAYLGIHNSMRSLGIMNEVGEGRAINMVKAYAWYRLAGDFIPKHWDEWYIPRSKILMFQNMAPKLTKKMTPEEIKLGKEYYTEIKSEVNCNFNSWLEEFNYFNEPTKLEHQIKLPNNQLREIIELALNLPELQMYYHIDQAPERLPIKIKEFDKINEINLKGIKMFEKDIIFLKDNRINGKRIFDYINVTKWSYINNQLILQLEYPVEGITMNYTFERKKLKWMIVSSQIWE